MLTSLTLSTVAVIMGPQGAGVSSALQGLALHGWTIIDNLHPDALDHLDWLSSLTQSSPPVALGLSHPATLELITRLKHQYPTLISIWLYARDEVLSGRTAAYSLPDFSISEKSTLTPTVDYGLDTSGLRVDELWAKLWHLLEGMDTAASSLTLVLQSFAFKRGVPADADWVLDVRFLPNPFYDPKLKPMTGLQSEVQDYVLSQPETGVFFDSLTGLLMPTLPHYQGMGRMRLTVSIGCTGGRHRSVTIVEKLAAFVQERNLPYHIIKHHRETPFW